MSDQTKVEKKKNRKGTPIIRAATGGIVGATAGYLSSPKNRKKITSRINKELLKSQGAKLGSLTKEKLEDLKDLGIKKSNNAFQNLKPSTSNLFNKEDVQEDYINEDEEDSDYEDVKEENEQLKCRLQNLEEKMNKLIEQNIDNNAEGEAAAAEESDKDETEEKSTKKSIKTEEVDEDKADTGLSNNDDTSPSA